MKVVRRCTRCHFYFLWSTAAVVLSSNARQSMPTISTSDRASQPDIYLKASRCKPLCTRKWSAITFRGDCMELYSIFTYRTTRNTTQTRLDGFAVLCVYSYFILSEMVLFLSSDQTRYWSLWQRQTIQSKNCMPKDCTSCNVSLSYTCSFKVFFVCGNPFRCFSFGLYLDLHETQLLVELV